MLLDLLISGNFPFVAYRMPNGCEPVIAVQQNGLPEIVELDALDGKAGFVVATFDAYKKGKVNLLTPTHILKSKEDKERFKIELSALPMAPTQRIEEQPLVIEKQAYLLQVTDLVRRMKAGEASKVVLSRVMSKALPAGFSYDKFFERLHHAYPSAMAYLFYLPGLGIWSGASPETLIKNKGEYFETMALAGTQRIGKEGEAVVWQQKEREEQAFVSQFIDDQLRQLDLTDYRRLPEETVIAGKLAHICTRFQIPAQSITGKLGKLVKTLHPTPAVCGLPRDKAWSLIMETETHQRSCYTGFLGPWNLEGEQHLFVNLRCGQFHGHTLNLYVGGGLTAQSLAEAEWQETEDKSQTLLSLVENLRNFAP